MEMSKLYTEDYSVLSKNMELDTFFSECYENIKKGILPKSYPNCALERIPLLGHIEKYTNWRDEYIREFGFPLFAENWVKPLASWIGNRPCLEIMAGTGYFSLFLRKYGVSVKATDNYSWNKKFNSFNNVENLDCLDAIKKYGKDVKFIICSWPYMDDMAYKSLLLMREINPKCRMIYIGEYWGGCTANDKFFDIAEECEIKSFQDAVSKYRRWYGLHDHIILYK